MKKKLFISLRSARTNSGLKQSEVVTILNKHYGIRISRQKLAEYEVNSEDVPINLAKALSGIYSIPENYIFFGKESTLSYINRSSQIV